MNARGIVTPGRFATLFHVLALTLLLAVAACNRPAVAEGSLKPITVPAAASVTIDVSSYFSEPDGQTSTYSAASSDSGVATVTATRPASSGTCR